ncbi:hypothetical protein [Ruminiclostridium josui]|uniref:hypothetical protein n=1 Tax=Ruminiclostridium josui TaxID=1499 RepID=UPI000ACC585A|nr:hypothetical protein [Ruminiclostridium josui]
MKYFKKACIALAALLISTSFAAGIVTKSVNAASTTIPPRKLERLDRGIVAINQGNGKVYVAGVFSEQNPVILHSIYIEKPQVA